MDLPLGLPAYAGSIIGAAMNKLFQGDDLGEVEQFLTADPRFAGVPQDILLTSLEVASANVNATQMLEALEPGWTFGNVFSEAMQTSGTVGVRIFIPYIDGQGRQQFKTLTINARMGEDIDFLLRTAVNYAATEGGPLSKYGGLRLNFGDARIAAVYAGGLESPTLTF